MTTTTTYKGMEPGAKSSSRVLRPPGGESSFSLGTDENGTPQRKNKMASSIFAEPDDPHAHRRNNPPTGAAAGTLCGEPSAPLRRCQQPLLFPKNPQPELTTIHNSGAAMVWGQRQESVPMMRRFSTRSKSSRRRHHSPLPRREMPWSPRVAEETHLVESPASSWVETTCFFHSNTFFYFLKIITPHHSLPPHQHVTLSTCTHADTSLDTTPIACPHLPPSNLFVLILFSIKRRKC
uniref:Jupiter microtubule associated homolog 1b n=1 Tax=Scophthalmus maximus TaxID=52904 RepID=A0A8D3CHU5_SCOMX